jgi:hypothetical protein
MVGKGGGGGIGQEARLKYTCDLGVVGMGQGSRNDQMHMVRCRRCHGGRHACTQLQTGVC